MEVHILVGQKALSLDRQVFAIHHQKALGWLVVGKQVLVGALIFLVSDHFLGGPAAGLEEDQEYQAFDHLLVELNWNLEWYANQDQDQDQALDQTMKW